MTCHLHEKKNSWSYFTPASYFETHLDITQAMLTIDVMESESESESQHIYCHKSTTKHRMKADQGVIARDKIPPYTYTNIYMYI